MKILFGGQCPPYLFNFSLTEQRIVYAEASSLALRGIAGFRVATLPGLEHKARRAMRFLGQPRVASASR
jgi:hypothetical protein